MGSASTPVLMLLLEGTEKKTMKLFMIIVLVVVAANGKPLNEGDRKTRGLFGGRTSVETNVRSSVDASKTNTDVVSRNKNSNNRRRNNGNIIGVWGNQGNNGNICTGGADCSRVSNFANDYSYDYE